MAWKYKRGESGGFLIRPRFGGASQLLRKMTAIHAVFAATPEQVLAWLLVDHGSIVGTVSAKVNTP